MGEALSRRILQTRFESPLQEALLNLFVASAAVRERSEKTAAVFGITLPQYNVLRILRGVHPEGHPRCEIARRMLDRAPDVTRLIDRLADKKLVERDRGKSDRRHSITRISPHGLSLLQEMQSSMAEALNAFAGKLSPDDARELSRLCELLYDEAPAPDL